LRRDPGLNGDLKWEGNSGARAGKIGYLRGENWQVMMIEVYDTEIDAIQKGEIDYFSLTDMIRARVSNLRVADWLRTKRTLQMLFAWEYRNNKNFNCGEFAAVMEGVKKPGSNSFKLGVKDWIQRTNAEALTVSEGKYGGTYGHSDIALDFARWVDPFLGRALDEVIRDRRFKITKSDKLSAHK
jgi:hypothetical protein